jgi:hypothetical protein
MNTRRGGRLGAWPSRLLCSRPHDQRKGLSGSGGDADPDGPAAEATTCSGSRSKTRDRAWVMLLVGLLVATTTTGGLLHLGYNAAQNAQARLLLSRVETHARHLSAVEWEKIAERQLPERSDIEENPADVEAELVRTVQQLRRLELNSRVGSPPWPPRPCPGGAGCLPGLPAGRASPVRAACVRGSLAGRGPGRAAGRSRL